MNLETQTVRGRRSPSEGARAVMEAKGCGPLFLADWTRAVFIHFETDPAVLQAEVPFELDLHEGRACVSLVAFDLNRMRLAGCGWLGEWLMRPLSNHGFLNVRTYVRHAGRTGIYFLAEWLSNPWGIPLGPPLFGLPYRFGRLDYRHPAGEGVIEGKVTSCSSGARLQYRGTTGRPQTPEPDSLEEFLLERYTAFTRWGRKSRLFHVWHKPWPVREANLELLDLRLLRETGKWCDDAELVSAHFSPGVESVWMGRPQTIHAAP